MAYFLKYFFKNSINAPQKEVNRNAPIIGFFPNNKPIEIPAKEACDNVSLIIDVLLTTRKTPMQGQSIEINKDTMIAF